MICTLNIRSVLHPVHFAALSDLIDSHHHDLFCLTETWIKPDPTPAELINCTPLSYSLLSFPRIPRQIDIILPVAALPFESVNLLHNSPAPLLNSLLSRHHLSLSNYLRLKFLSSISIVLLTHLYIPSVTTLSFMTLMNFYLLLPPLLMNL